MSELILALDTTHEFGSIALLSGDEVLESLLLHAPEGFGHILYPQMERLLKRHGARVQDIDCFGATSGPGSFTGVRIGLACVKGLSEAIRKPVIAVSNLRVLAQFGAKPLRAAVLDARRGEIYGAVYDSDLNLVAPEVVARFPAWLHSLPQGDIEFIAMDFSPFEGSLRGTAWEFSQVTIAPRALAGAVGRVTLRSFRLGQASDPARVDANYIRRSDAELLRKDESILR